MTLALVITVVVVALLFDFTNGFHDAANAVATAISTRALTPKIALLLAAVMNFVGALLGQKVAGTVTDVVGASLGHHFLIVILAGLLGAIGWNLTTWWFGLPSSSTHALIGGVAGAAIVAGTTVHWSVILEKVVIPMVVSPLVGFAVTFLLMSAILVVFRRRNAQKVNRGFRGAQTITASALALGHGLQDGQKTMGVIVLALFAGGYLGGVEAPKHASIPLWVIFAAATAISIGTWTGGWRIMRTLGHRIIKVDPPRGFAAEAVASTLLYTTAYMIAAPISTTHVVSSSIMGAGATRGLGGVRWSVAGSILLAWVLTFPGAGLLAAGAYGLLSLA